MCQRAREETQIQCQPPAGSQGSLMFLLNSMYTFCVAKKEPQITDWPLCSSKYFIGPLTVQLTSIKVKLKRHELDDYAQLKSGWCQQWSNARRVGSNNIGGGETMLSLGLTRPVKSPPILIPLPFASSASLYYFKNFFVGEAYQILHSRCKKIPCILLCLPLDKQRTRTFSKAFFISCSVLESVTVSV